MKTTVRSVLTLSVLGALGLHAPLGAAQSPSPAAAQAQAQTEAPSSAEGSRLIGVQFAEQLSHLGIAPDLQVDQIAKGLKEGMTGRALNPAEQAQIRAFVTKSMAAAVDRNRSLAKTFLERNAKEEGVKTTASGLQYKVLASGPDTGTSPQPTDQATVNYKGTLLDGSEFDSSYKRGQPATFPVNGVIKGWQEALSLMKPGDKWQVFVPPELGYDAAQRPGIPAGSLLIFEVELLEVKTPEAKAPEAKAPEAKATDSGAGTSAKPKAPKKK